MDWLVNSAWSILVWAVLYTSNHILSVLAGQLSESGAERHLVYEKDALALPVAQKNASRPNPFTSLRLFNIRFLVSLVLMTLMLLFFWYNRDNPLYFPGLYEFVLGGMMLLQGVAHIGHASQLTLLRYARNSQGIDGQVTFSAWLNYRQSAFELLAFGTLFLAIYLLTGRIFFLGGMALCLVTGLAHLRHSNRTRMMGAASR